MLLAYLCSLDEGIKKHRPEALNPWKSKFGIHSGLPKPPKSLLKATQNQACFATLWNPPGPRRKLTGVATFGLRKWLGIWLGLLDLPLVALIIKVRSATWHAPRISLLSGRRNQKTSSRGTKIHENRTPRASKSIRKAASKRYCFRGGLRTSIFSKNCDFLMIFGFQNGAQIQEKRLKMRC